MDKMPVLFVGHGSPMIALADNHLTNEFKRIGDAIISRHSKPEAILMISAHWYTRGQFINSQSNPRQVYDMYGFPQALYDISYPVEGSPKLAHRVIDTLGDEVSINNEWGVDHGAWTVLVHIFPGADIPVVQLSVDGTKTAQDIYSLAQQLQPLREAGYLIVGSGNLVHNLAYADFSNPSGSLETKQFDEYIYQAIMNGNYEYVINYQNHPLSSYAAPTPEHYLPLVYALGASGNDIPLAFNRSLELSTISMTSFVFGMEENVE